MQVGPAVELDTDAGADVEASAGAVDEEQAEMTRVNTTRSGQAMYGTFLASASLAVRHLVDPSRVLEPTSCLRMRCNILVPISGVGRDRGAHWTVGRSVSGEQRPRGVFSSSVPHEGREFIGDPLNDARHLL